MTFAWQHFKAIEYGYKIETLRVQRDGLAEMNRALHLEEASLRDPERIDTLARKLGLQSPQAGQVMHMDTVFTGRRNAGTGQRDPGRDGFCTIRKKAESHLAWTGHRPGRT